MKSKVFAGWKSKAVAGLTRILLHNTTIVVEACVDAGPLGHKTENSGNDT